MSLEPPPSQFFPWENVVNIFTVHCYYCFTGTNGKGDLKPGEYQFVADLFREGPYAKPSHAICNDCLKIKRHLLRSRCEACGRVKSLLFTENNSMTSSMVSLGNPPRTVCRQCVHKQLPVSPFPPVYLTEDDIEILKRAWKLPEWKKLTKMPHFLRSIDDY